MVSCTKWRAAALLLPAWLFLSSSSLKAQEGVQITVQFASSSYTVNENAGAVDLTVTLSSSASSVVTVKYATSDGTAIAGTDYIAVPETVLTFNPGVTSQTISVDIIDNGNYSNQSVYFTVALSQPTNATLGTPSTTTVNILDNDPAPVADIEINGVPTAQKNNPGGYIQVNANNDYGNPLLYSDGTPTGGKYGIPSKRDFDVAQLESPDPDIVEVTLKANNLKPGGPENIVLSVTTAGRAQIVIWQDALKNNPELQTPTNWTAATMLSPVYVEGLLEGAALREVTLKLQILNNGKIVSTDTCTLTVTPVLTNFVVTKTAGAAPGVVNDAKLGWSIGSEVGGGGKDAFTESVSARWNAVRGSLRFIQNWKNVNKLAGGWGADLGPRKWDFAAPNAGLWLVDCIALADVPLYKVNENLNVANGVATNSVTDSPALPLNWVNNVLPAVGKTTNVDVTYSFTTYATIAFNDNSIYCLGQQSWNVRYTGAVKQPAAGNYTYTPAAGNHDPSYGYIQPSKQGYHAWQIMELIAKKDLQDGYWEKTEGGYRLAGTPVVAAPDAVSTNLTQARPAAAASRRSRQTRVIFSVASLVLLVILAILRMRAAKGQTIERAEQTEPRL